MRILICGDRDWDDRALIRQHLMHAIETSKIVGTPLIVIEGEARGADTLAREEATALGIQVVGYPAEWMRLGKRAGPVRNTQMLKEGKPDIVWAFHDHIDESKGTKNMVEQARKAGLPVFLFSHATAGRA